MKNSVYPPRCFSSQCGLCFTCTESKFNDESAKEKEIGDILRQFEKSTLDDLCESYLNRNVKRYQRDSMGETLDGKEEYYGILPNTYHVDETPNDISVYRKQQGPHDKICDMGLCRAIYHSLPSYTQSKVYAKLPIYVRDIRANVKNDVSCTLCYDCVSA